MESLQVNWKMMHKSKKLKIFIYGTCRAKTEIDIDDNVHSVHTKYCAFLTGKVMDC